MTSGHKFQKGDRVVLLDGKYVYQGAERPDLSADLAGVVGVVTRERGRKTSEHDPDYGVLFEHERCEGNNTHYVDEGSLILESDLVSDEDVAAAIASIVNGYITPVPLNERFNL